MSYSTFIYTYKGERYFILRVQQLLEYTVTHLGLLLAISFLIIQRNVYIR